MPPCVEKHPPILAVFRVVGVRVFGAGQYIERRGTLPGCAAQLVL